LLAHLFTGLNSATGGPLHHLLHPAADAADLLLAAVDEAAAQIETRRPLVGRLVGKLDSREFQRALPDQQEVAVSFGISTRASMRRCWPMMGTLGSSPPARGLQTQRHGAARIG
jgi:hypothetical protein